MAESFPTLFSPTAVGPMDVQSRIMHSPHAGAIGRIFGSESEARRNIEYWRRRAAGGPGWVVAITGFVENQVAPGFEPTGLGGTARGVYRFPHFVERAGRLAEAIHEGGAYALCQLVLQGGKPHAPSTQLLTHLDNLVGHALDTDQITELVDEYGHSAAQVEAAGMDGVEFHACHDDLLEWFLSPLTNRRDDDYGGDPGRRLRFLVEAIESVRRRTGPGFAVGVRLNIDECVEGGYGPEGALEIARALEATGQVDYLSWVMGNNWSRLSYLQTPHFGTAPWAPLVGEIRRRVRLPCVYVGRVTSPTVAEEILVAGDADVVGMARAIIAEPDLLVKARAGRVDQIRPCIGCNECLHRTTVDGLPTACSVNPRSTFESEPDLDAVDVAKSVLVVGGGPAGMELAALAAERGHRVTLLEREAELGGQMRIASFAAENSSFADFVRFQERRLKQLGVDVSPGCDATADDVVDFAADVVAVATGAAPRVPEIPGVDLPFVVEGRDVLLGRAEVGDRAVVIAEENHAQPLTIAGHLVDLGKQVRVVLRTRGVAPFVGKYSIGAAIGKLIAGGGELVMMERVVAIEAGRVRTRHVFAESDGELTDVDTVVLACGGVPEVGLHQQLMARGGLEVHLLGDAYAPRRITFATRQAYELAKLL